jgi:hypothetical protein
VRTDVQVRQPGPHQLRALNYARDFFLPSEVSAPWLTRGNDTPANRAWIQSILDRYPNPATLTPDPRSNRTYATTFGINYPDQDYSGRLDWQLGQDSIVTRYQYTAQRRENEDIIEGEQTLQDNQQQNLGITWTKVLRGNLIGEARYGLGCRQTNVDIAADGNHHRRFTGSPVSARSSATAARIRSTGSSSITSSSTTSRGSSSRYTR